MNRIGTCLSADDAERVIASTKQAILNFKNSRKERKLSIEASLGQLQKAVESQHGGTVALAPSVPLTETLDAVVWENVVHVFDLKGHPAASRAYAWSSPIEGSDKHRFFAGLHQGPVKSPLEAVRAAIVSEGGTK